ncbi:uncharacterized protein [Parasteatoda tepidariorum]|uniref:uncharacterized protein n=1 Tax=Parasteatoda tepidariorum TaxID=114398 RepID=UPI0039BCC61C
MPPNPDVSIMAPHLVPKLACNDYVPPFMDIVQQFEQAYCLVNFPFSQFALFGSATPFSFLAVEEKEAKPENVKREVLQDLPTAIFWEESQISVSNTFLFFTCKTFIILAANALGANKKKPGLLGGIAGGLETFGNNVLGGLNQAASDFFCGFNRVFNKIGSKAGKGDLIGAVLSGANTFITGAGSFFGNAGTNALGAITSGVSDGIHGRRGKKGYVHDRSSGKKNGGGLLGGLFGG